MKFQVICLLIYGIRSSLQLHENYCYNASTDNHFCCFNYEWTNLTCIECKIGTTTREEGGGCLPCKHNMYGVLCSETCDCNPYERCDNEVGCISKSTVLSKEDAASNIYVNVYQLLQNERQENIQLENGNRLSPDSYSVRDKTLGTAIPSRYRTSNSQYCTYKYAESEITIDACARGSIESNKDKSITEEKSKTL
ncbi:unnamed protein product [Mytilus edulis]|uniref:Uncharacterized protein n=1 Tax=Mytilus edulis TaxID=6550 RepID=A0A8S3T5Z6_MYTED|nr:unnamed protein product [Mytilus edulis]